MEEDLLDAAQNAVATDCRKGRHCSARLMVAEEGAEFGFAKFRTIIERIKQESPQFHTRAMRKVAFGKYRLNPLSEESSFATSL